jgi:histone H4
MSAQLINQNSETAVRQREREAAKQAQTNSADAIRAKAAKAARDKQLHQGKKIGLGKGGAMRHKTLPKKQMPLALTKPGIRRLARRGGVKRMIGLVYEEIRGGLRVYLEDVIGAAVLYTAHARRRTVTALDIVHALKRVKGTTLYP